MPVDSPPDKLRLPTSAVVCGVLGLALGVAGFALIVLAGALGLLLFGPSTALLATAFAIARKRLPDG